MARLHNNKRFQLRYDENSEEWGHLVRVAREHNLTLAEAIRRCLRAIPIYEQHVFPSVKSYLERVKRRQ